MNKKILLSLLVLLGVAVLGQSAYASSADLSVFPSTASHNAGTTFNVTVRIDPQGNQVCVVRGILNLSNLTCKGITLASGVVAQTAPTCASPSFVLGITKCATNVQNLLSVSVSGVSAGQASLSPAGASVIGSGTAVNFIANGGSYNITPAPVTIPATESVTTTIQEDNSASQITVPSPAQQTDQTDNQPPVTGQQASLANTSPSKTIVIVLFICFVIMAILGIWYSSKRKKEDKKS